MLTHEMIREGSMVAVIGHEKLEKDTVYLLVMHNGKVVAQQRLQKGDEMLMVFISMTVWDLECWLHPDIFETGGETRKLINSFEEVENVEPVDGYLPLPRPRQAGHHGERKPSLWEVVGAKMGNGNGHEKNTVPELMIITS